MRTNTMRFSALIAAALIATAGAQSLVFPQPALAENEEARFALATFPVDSSNVRFSDTWGASRSGGRRHSGTDIVSERGTPVVAVADGTIVKMGLHRLSGYYLVVEHKDGWISSYLHLNNDTVGTDDGEGGPWTAFFPTLVEGQEVSAGDVIGYVGDSGNAENTTPNVHFEIKHEDTKENPYPLLTDALDRRLVPWILFTGPR
ncbi:MAG: M23 family metallopeptidase [Actinomycetia bacterium]|nr:M23 family metallopeptidase [Actinomycetes bacterium]